MMLVIFKLMKLKDLAKYQLSIDCISVMDAVAGCQWKHQRNPMIPACC